MKILYFTHANSDYLQDGLLFGLKILFKDKIIDYPKKEWIYKDNDIDINKQERKEFTFFRILNDFNINRENIKQRIINNEFDIIIFSSIHRQIDILKEFYPIIKNRKVAIFDGEDHPSLFGYNGKYWRNAKYWLLPKVHKQFIYFKREYTPETVKYRYYKLLPDFLCKKIKIKNVYPISFSFPDNKINKEEFTKTKQFPEHIVDNEIAQKINKKTKYVFNEESDYYIDLQLSKFGISTKRAGWDCMRHYEIAANQSVICLKNLSNKAQTCAPHGLDSSNCIDYVNYEDLMLKLKNLTDEEYKLLQYNTKKWITANTCSAKAEYTIKTINEYYSAKNDK